MASLRPKEYRLYIWLEAAGDSLPPNFDMKITSLDVQLAVMQAMDFCRLSFAGMICIVPPSEREGNRTIANVQLVDGMLYYQEVALSIQ